MRRVDAVIRKGFKHPGRATTVSERRCPMDDLAVNDGQDDGDVQK